MKVRMLSLAAGPDGVLLPGAEVEIPDDPARALVAGGYAVAVGSASSPTAPGSPTGGVHVAGIEHAVDANVALGERRADFGGMLLSGIDGIGPVFAGRLAEGGIETVAELLNADAAEVALLAGAKPAQVTKWRQRAQAWLNDGR